ncbi:TetR/AcrR family transcriptional regulator [Bacillus paranthracis]|uniref:TetR/AcrR family transcriptional regulator n=1 Tax=Bacillus paranthracis TaxID=2026186 RepID=UPI000200F5F6|nr:TetR/AcrR family transcriptional regulator [Bacillus paranthracis]ADY20432.1 TetR family transcriptional regulator [Bacillus thuringiensis serovar finitimus YBT-020]MDA1584306.1 TetR/AcrR family transcriptional regulator [Bacillus cereus group sp. TH230-1LC]MRC72910.1 TetR family transcriptional regulator [Bacillus thuringiensis]OTX71368.1 TetR family transcriptional regulator [Bacillus thuringiensis serovar finitimus]MCR6799299.1 TetR/AcrR family transcriptional regulator [Bacillus paranth
MTKNLQTSQNIVEASFKLMAEHGIEKMSLSMIAKEVGISKPAIYYHFSSKEALVDFLFEEIFSGYHFVSYFDKEQYTKENFAEKLISDGLHMLSEYEGQEGILRVINEFIVTASRNEKYQKRLFEIQEEFLNGFHDLLKKGVGLDVVSQQATEENAHTLALVINNMSNYMLMGFQLKYKEIWIRNVKNVMKEE